MSKKVRKYLTVTIEASSEVMAEDLIEQLARSACDIANSTEDDKAHIWIIDQVKP